ncbi:MAG: hypothetical protein ACFFDW_01955 [Candidatus Thorarchaeota archaeon]
MSGRFLGFISVHRKIEQKMIQFAFIPSKYFEALYVECNTQIHCHTLDIMDAEEKNVRRELLTLMKQGEVDTKIEIGKYQLFERLNEVIIKSKEIRDLMNQFCEEIKKESYTRLVKILMQVSKAGKAMYQAVKTLYDNYDLAIANVDTLNKTIEPIIDDIFSFKFCTEEGQYDYSFEDPQVLIGNAIRATLQDMNSVGDKIIEIIADFSFNHFSLKEKIKQIKSEEPESEEQKENEKC